MQAPAAEAAALASRDAAERSGALRASATCTGSTALSDAPTPRPAEPSRERASFASRVLSVARRLLLEDVPADGPAGAERHAPSDGSPTDAGSAETAMPARDASVGQGAPEAASFAPIAPPAATPADQTGAGPGEAAGAAPGERAPELPIQIAADSSAGEANTSALRGLGDHRAGEPAAGMALAGPLAVASGDLALAAAAAAPLLVARDADSDEAGAVQPAPAERERGAPASALVDDPAGAKPALCGHSSVVSVPDVLGMLANLRKTGWFGVWNEHDAFRIRLVRGTVVSARATGSAPEFLIGTILVEHGAIPAATLSAFAARNEHPTLRLGDALVAAGLIERAALARAIKYQAQRVFHAAYDLRDAWYRFDQEQGPEIDERGMSVTHLLLESARIRDETSQRLDDVLGDPFRAG